MPVKTFGQLVDELIVVLEEQEIPDKIVEAERKPGDPGDKFEVMTTKSVWFADMTNDAVRRMLSKGRLQKKYMRSPLQVLWEEGEKGLENIKKVISDGCCH